MPRIGVACAGHRRWSGETLRWAVVGGSGCIGRALVEALRERGDDVFVLTRKAPRTPQEIRWDPNKGVEKVQRLDGLDGVFNLCGEPLANRPWTSQRRTRLWSSRVDATETLLNALGSLNRRPAFLLGVSSAGLYGDRGEEAVDETTPPGSGFLADLSTAWEAANQRASGLGMRVAVLRMTVVLSPDGGAFPNIVAPFRYMGGWLGDGRQYTGWISRRDTVNAMIHLASRPDLAGAFNGTVPEPVTNREWSLALGRALNRPVLTHAPRWALRGALGELADALFLASIRAVPRRLLDSGFIFQDTSIEETFRWLLAKMR